MNQLRIKNLTLAAMFLALGLVLPFLTGQIPQIGVMLSPMHYPVLLCGFICGWQYGALVGFICPLLRSVLFGMPPMPSAIPMAFELMTYGCLAGLIYSFFKEKNLTAICVTLVLAMLGGRIVWGIAQMVMHGVRGTAFTFSAFLAGAFTNAFVGIVLQLILIPLIMVAVNKIKKA